MWKNLLDFESSVDCALQENGFVELEEAESFRERKC